MKSHLNRTRSRLLQVTLAGCCALILGGEPAPKVQPKAVDKPVAEKAVLEKTGPEKSVTDKVEKGGANAKLQPLNKQGTVLLDLEGKRLLLKSHICLRKGVLELLCCLKQTKEHEAILSVDTKAYVVHAGLLALGAEVGSPVQFEPAFKPASGQTIDIFVNWTDEKGQARRVAAQEWVRYVTQRFYAEKLAKYPDDLEFEQKVDELRYDPKEQELIWYGPMTEEVKQKYLAKSKDKGYRECIERFFKRSQSRQMEAHWVFSGSGYYVDEDTKQKFYRAEDGDLICVANFGSATLDIATRSGNGSEELLFEAWTERLPEIGTPVTIELIPVKAAKAKGADQPDAAKPAQGSSKEPAAKEGKPTPK